MTAPSSSLQARHQPLTQEAQSLRRWNTEFADSPVTRMATSPAEPMSTTRSASLAFLTLSSEDARSPVTERPSSLSSSDVI